MQYKHQDLNLKEQMKKNFLQQINLVQILNLIQIDHIENGMQDLDYQLKKKNKLLKEN